MSEFRERLVAAMTRENLGQSALARKAGVPQTTVSSWLKGHLPRKFAAQALANSLGVSVDWLLRGEGDEFPPTESSREAAYRLREGDENACEISPETAESGMGIYRRNLHRPLAQGLAPAAKFTDADLHRFVMDEAARLEKETHPLRRLSIVHSIRTTLDELERRNAANNS